MRLNNFFLFVVLMISNQSLQAQIVNIENRRIYDDTSGWSGSLDGSFSIQQNSKLFYNLGFRPRAQFKNRKNYILAIGDVSYTGSQGQTYANSGMIHFRYARRIKNGPWKWESYTQTQYNQLLDQKNRTIVGTGLRWKFVDTNHIRGFLGSSVFYEYEELRVEKTFHNDVRWSNYISWFLPIKKIINFTGTTYYQPLLKDFSDFRFSGNYGLSIIVSKHLDLRFDMNLFYDSNPPENVLNMVYSTTVGFRVKLGE